MAGTSLLASAARSHARLRRLSYFASRMPALDFRVTALMHARVAFAHAALHSV